MSSITVFPELNDDLKDVAGELYCYMDLCMSELIYHLEESEPELNYYQEKCMDELN